jgi:predicted acylesterase/phospholipase RssA
MEQPADQTKSGEDNVVSNLIPPKETEFDTIVLSGGAAKGLCSLGALQCAEDSFRLTRVTNFVGTSVGAIICYLIAIGFKPVEIVVWICTHQLLETLRQFDVVNMVSGVGATSFGAITDQLEHMTISKIGRYINLKDLKELYGKTLICATYNRTKRKTEYLSPITHPDLPCLTALRMSANFPYIFEKFLYMGDFFVDGGISDNFPIDIGDGMGEKVLGIVLNETEDEHSDVASIKLSEDFYELVGIPMATATAYKILNASAKCTIVSISYPKFKVFNFNIPASEKLEMFSKGYNEARKILNK